jgi:hypothetical protein
MAAVASEDFWPRFNKLNKIECNESNCQVNIKQFLYDKVIHTTVDLGGNTFEFTNPVYESDGTKYGFAQPLYAPNITSLGLNDKAYTIPAGYLCHLESEFWKQRLITTVKIGAEIGISVYFSGPRLAYGFAKAADYIVVGASVVSTLSETANIIISASDCTGDPEFCKDLQTFFSRLSLFAAGTTLGTTAIDGIITAAKKASSNIKYSKLAKDKKDLIDPWLNVLDWKKIVTKFDDLDLGDLKTFIYNLGDDAAKARFAKDLQNFTDEELITLADNLHLLDDWKKLDASIVLERNAKFPDWLKKIRDGKDFDDLRKSAYAYNQVYLINPKDPKKYVILDSYSPPDNIVSRKFTQLHEISETTGKKYIQELLDKYKGIRGKQILEVPVQNGPIPTGVLQLARDKDIIIRDILGKIY